MKTVYGQFCPVAVASEIFAERWTPVILREMFMGSTRFNDIHRGLPRISRALLARRLRQLEAAEVIASTPAPNGRGREYRPTECGEELRELVMRLGAWGQRWTARVDRSRLDPTLLMWDMRRRIAVERLPAGRTVVRFDFRGVPVTARFGRKYWLLLERSGEVDVCVTDPGFEVNVYVAADLAAFTGIWLGDQAFAHAARAGSVTLSGDPRLTRAFPSWLKLSTLAAVPRAMEHLQRRVA